MTRAGNASPAIPGCRDAFLSTHHSQRKVEMSGFATHHSSLAIAFDMLFAAAPLFLRRVARQIRIRGAQSREISNRLIRTDFACCSGYTRPAKAESRACESDARSRRRSGYDRARALSRRGSRAMLGMPHAARRKWPTRPFALAAGRRYLDHSGPSRSQLGHARAGHRRLSVVHRRTGRKDSRARHRAQRPRYSPAHARIPSETRRRGRHHRLLALVAPEPFSTIAKLVWRRRLAGDFSPLSGRGTAYFRRLAGVVADLHLYPHGNCASPAWTTSEPPGTLPFFARSHLKNAVQGVGALAPTFKPPSLLACHSSPPLQ